MAQRPGNIAQFDSPIDSLRPDNGGAEALSQAARQEGALYRQAGEDVKSAGNELGSAVGSYETMQEISQGSAALATLHNNLTKQWNQVASTANPNDTTIQDKFMNESVQPAMQQFQDGFTTTRGQEWALSQADNLVTHYNDKTSADMSARAGDAVVQNMKTTLSQLSDAARKDPSSMDSSFAQVDSLVAATKEHNVGNLTPEQIDKIGGVALDMKNEIAKSGVQGLADVNPKAAVSLINSGKLKDYISGTEGDSLIKYSEAITRMKLEDQQRGYEQQKRAQEQAEQVTANKVLTSLYNPQTGQISIPANINQTIFQNPSLSAKGKLELMGAVKHISEDSTRDDPSVLSSNADRLDPNSTNPLTPSDLLSQLSKGQITQGKYTFYAGLLDKTPDAVAEKTAVKNALTEAQKTILATGAPGIQPSDQQRQNQIAFTNWFMPAYQQAMQDPDLKGKSQAQKAAILLSSTDPKGLLTPEKMAPFKTSAQQILSNSVAGVGPLPSGTSIPGATSAFPAKDTTDIAKEATATRFMPATKTWVYLNPKTNTWTDKDGKDVK